MKPRFTAESAPTVCISLHIISHLRHIIHLSISLIIEGDVSFLYLDCSPSYGRLLILNCVARLCSSHCPDFAHTRQSNGWSEIINFKTVVRAFSTLILWVFITIPSCASVIHEGARFLRPSTSTTHILHPPGLFSILISHSSK